MYRLQGRIRQYPWGSREVIARLQGRPAPSSDPEAELWFGAHPDCPALLDGGRPMDEVITAAPQSLLGADCVRRFGPRLPYLLKLLAAERPLSLQAHPDATQALAGYAAEEAAGVPRDSPHRSYVDRHHKPELLVAVTDFEALCGFRHPKVSAEAFDALAVDELRPVLAVLANGELREAVQLLLSWPRAGRRELIGKVAESAGRLDEPAARLVRALAQAYPSDLGVAVALLLNHVSLRPGEAIWMPAGNLHAYLRGTGVELMAASDNVLRGGLTGKHVNVPELLRVLRFEALEQPYCEGLPVAAGVRTWPVPVRDFRLHHVRLDADVSDARLDLAGPRVVLCLHGRVRLSDGVGGLDLAAGQAAFVTDGGPLEFAGVGELYVASL